MTLDGPLQATSFQGGLNATNVSAGTLSDTRLSANVALLNSSPTFAGQVQATSFQGSGSGLTGLNAGNISSGTLADARLSANVALLNTSATFAGDIAMSGAYHKLSLSGGNALGYLYGSYPKWGDGIHLGYNYFADSFGIGHVSNTGGATSRLTVGYGFVQLSVGGVNTLPNTQRLLANSTGVTVYGTFNNSSDRNLKQGFATVNPSQVLQKVIALPVSEWSYKEDPTTRHVGPVAQDFYSTFNIGTDDKHIAPMDEGGVALAAIKGLNEKLETENAQLKARLEKLERLLDERIGDSK